MNTDNTSLGDDVNDQFSRSLEYLEKEVDYLRSTYSEHRKETRALETYALLAVGAVWSWCATNSSYSQVPFVLWVPFIIANLFGIRAFGVYMQMRTIQKYLANLEKTEKLPCELGWEDFIGKDYTRAIWPITAFIFWGTLCILTSIAPSFW